MATNHRIHHLDTIIFRWIVACCYHDPYIGFIASLRPQRRNNADSVYDMVEASVSVGSLSAMILVEISTSSVLKRY